jgi:hypothetical protein
MRNLAVVTALIVAGSLGTAAARPAGRAGVTIASSSDTSPGVLDAHVRQRHGEIARRSLGDALRRSGADARHAGIPPTQLDITIVAWHVAPSASRIDVSIELRVVICDGHGRMLSIVTGRASVSAPSPGAPLAQLREQALAEAVGGVARSLRAQLQRATS